MDWLLAMGYGAIGGAVVEAVVSSDRVLAWNAARHQALTRQPATPVPALSAYVDPLSDVAAGLTRVLLGAVAGLLFSSQVTGAYAAIAVGCSAPTVLRQLGSARLGSAFEIEAGPVPEQRVESAAPLTEKAAEHPAEPTAEHANQPAAVAGGMSEQAAGHPAEPTAEHPAEQAPERPSTPMIPHQATAEEQA